MLRSVPFNCSFSESLLWRSSGLLLDIIIGNGYGIALLDGSTNNNIRFNTLVGNILDQDGIHLDEDSKLNVVKDNRISPSCHKPPSLMNSCGKTSAR